MTVHCTNCVLYAATQSSHCVQGHRGKKCKFGSLTGLLGWVTNRKTVEFKHKPEKLDGGRRLGNRLFTQVRKQKSKDRFKHKTDKLYTLLEKVWWISLHVTDDAMAKLYVT